MRNNGTKTRIVKIFGKQKFWYRGFRKTKKDIQSFKKKVRKEPSLVRVIQTKDGYILYSRPTQKQKKKKKRSRK